MSNIEKNLSGNLSTFFLNKNADMIPKNLSIIPKEKNSLWESLSKEILTPFSSKPNLYPNEKYLLKKKSQGITTQISSFDSIDNSIDNPQTAISFMTLNPKLDKLQSTKLKLVKNFNIKPFFLPLKSKKIFLKERVSRNLIFKKSHSINLEKSVNMSSENSKILKINLEKLKRIVIPKPKPNSSLMETMRKHSARVKNLVMSKNSIEIPKMKEVFRNRSCVCRYCGKNGKLEKNTTKFLKLHFPETNNSPNLKKIQSSAGIKKMMGSPLRKNVKSGESLKEFGCYELTNKRNSIILRCLKEENEIKPITLTMEKSKVSILTQKSIKNEENQKNQNSFILKKYK